MRRFILITFSFLFFLSNLWTQETYKLTNKQDADSLLKDFKTHRCNQLASTIKKQKKKARLDKRLVIFLNDFYNIDLTTGQIANRLNDIFKQSPWRFDQVTKKGDLTKYEGRLRSFGNIEAFIGYVSLNEKIIAKRIFFQTRSHLDCANPYDYLGLPDIIYLQTSAISIIQFPIDFSQWYNFIFSDIKYDKSLSQDTIKSIEAFFRNYIAN